MITPIRLALQVAACIALLVALIVVLPDPLAADGEPPATDPETTLPVVAPHVVARRVYRRKRVVSRERFIPDSRPLPGRVHRIIAHEAALWGASSARLSCRINGESTFRWDAANGQYLGLGQFAHETFYRGMASIGTRKVRTVVRRVRRPRSVVKVAYSDGTVRRTRGGRYRQVRYRVYTGWIPLYVERTHGWAQVRIMARAMVGMGNVNDSEWEVRC